MSRTEAPIRMDCVSHSENTPMLEKDFITPPEHIRFRAKKFYSGEGKVLDCAVAHMEKDGGGPLSLHTHNHDHLFFVVAGEAKVCFADSALIIRKNESCLVEGRKPHSVWNNLDTETVIIGMSIIK
jgi:mannose-6-phosphate isomerase-like protein (cupin superfamily)